MEEIDKFEEDVRCEKDSSSYRRSNKPLMEKRRRARINDCLVQLKALVLQAMRKDNAQYSKLEKADILEMTVKHLRQLQRHHVTPMVSRDADFVSKYRVGFNECANEVVRFLKEMEGTGTEIRTRLLNHLAGCMETSNVMCKTEPTASVHHQPLRVIVPQHENRCPRTMQSTSVQSQFQGYNNDRHSERLLVAAEDLSMSKCNANNAQHVQRVLQGQSLQLDRAMQSRDNQNCDYVTSESRRSGQPVSPLTGSRSPHVKTVSGVRQKIFNPSTHPYTNVTDTFSSRKQQCNPMMPYDTEYSILHCGNSRTPSPLELSSDKLWRPW